MTVTDHQTTENIELFRRILDDVLSGDLSEFNGLFAEDVMIQTPLGRFDGRDGYRAYLEESFAAVPDHTCVVIDAFGSGDMVAGRMTMSGTQTGESARLGIPATGKRFELPGANVARFEDGRCVEMWTFWDRLDLLQALDVAPM